MTPDRRYDAIDLLTYGWSKPAGGSTARLCEFFPGRFPGVLGIGASAAGWQEPVFPAGTTRPAAFRCPEYDATPDDVESALDIVLHITIRITWVPGGSRFVVDITLTLFTLLLCSSLANLRRTTGSIPNSLASLLLGCTNVPNTLRETN